MDKSVSNVENVGKSNLLSPSIYGSRKTQRKRLRSRNLEGSVSLIDLEVDRVVDEGEGTNLTRFD